MKHFLIFLLSSIPTVLGDCWNTGCQLDSWAVKGCEQYNRVENGRKSCYNGGPGQIYTCCTGSAPPPGSGNGGDGDAKQITQDQFSRAVTSNGYPAPTQAQFNAFKAGMRRGSISTKQEAAMALANFLHESDGLRAKREYACERTNCPGSYATSGCDYQGQYYYGRGYIQLSWCYNYKPASMDLYGDERLVRDPDMVARNEQVAWDTAYWFWGARVHSKQGVSEGRFGVTVRAINGGIECDGNRQDQARKRFEMYGQVRGAFGLSGKGDERGCYN